MLEIDPPGTNSNIWSVGKDTGLTNVVRVPSDRVTDANCRGPWALVPIFCAVGFNALDEN